MSGACVTPLKIYPPGAPTGLFVLLCLLTEEIGGGGSTVLTSRRSHHGYAASYVRTRAPTASPVRAQAASLYISVSFHRFPGLGGGI